MAALRARRLSAWALLAFAATLSLGISFEAAGSQDTEKPPSTRTAAGNDKKDEVVEPEKKKPAAAATPKADKPANAAGDSAKATSPHDPVPDVEVIGVRSNRKDSGRGTLGDDILVTVSDLNAFERAAAERGKTIILFFDGRPLRGVTLERSIPHAETAAEKQPVSGDLRFNLHRHDDSPEAKATWVAFVRKPRIDDDRNVLVSVGVEDALPQPVKGSPKSNFKLRVMSSGIFAVCILAFAAFAIVFGVFAFRKKSNMLRDSDAPVTWPGPPPYSLGRSQMAFWFFLVIGAYMLLWIVTGGFNTLTAGVLGLIGISAATTVSAALIDRGKETADEEAATTLLTRDQIREGNDKLADYQTKLCSLRRRMNDLASASPAEGSDEAKEWAAKNTEYMAIVGTRDLERRRLGKGGCGGPSEGFFRDILSDSHGISFHRFQMAVWTIILAIIFVKEVYYNLAMPEFDALLLGLMGISSGTYIGFKFKEA